MTLPITLLVIEDQPTDVEQLVELLRQAGYAPTWQRVETETDFLAHLSPPPDLIFADLVVPNLEPLGLLRLLRERELDIPFIVVSGVVEEEMAAECFKRGATDFLMKHHLNRVGQTVASALEQKRLRSEMQHMIATLRQNERKYRQLVETLHEGIWVVDENAVTQYVNPRLVELLGYSAEELQGRKLLDFLDKGWEEQLDVKFTRQDGSSFYANLASAPLLDETGRKTGTLFSLSDVSERKHGEAIRAATYKIAQAANACISLAELYASIQATLCELIPAQNFYLALYEPATEEFTFPYFVDQKNTNPERIKADGTLAAYTLRAGQPVFLSEAELKEAAKGSDFPAAEVDCAHWLGVPLHFQGKPVGLMAILSHTPEIKFGLEEASILSFVSTQVAMALEHKRVEDELRLQANTDPLTGLFNRRHFFELAEQEFERAQRYGRPLSAIMVDVDNLKYVNDTLGHLAGDLLIQSVGDQLHKSLRRVDLVGRYGGDEFVVLLPETPLAKAIYVIERLRQHVAYQPLRYEDSPIQTSISVGVAPIEADCRRLETLLSHADEALYVAKQGGKNRVSVWGEPVE